MSSHVCAFIASHIEFQSISKSELVFSYIMTSMGVNLREEIRYKLMLEVNNYIANAPGDGLVGLGGGDLGNW